MQEVNAGLNAVEELIAAAKNGEMFILVDDENRENEGDLVIAAEMVTAASINFLITQARGLVCLCLTQQRAQQLDLPLMVKNNTSRFGTAFTVSIGAMEGITTGISAADRAHTILTAIDPQKSGHDLSKPGHIFPLIAKNGGVLKREGHTEAAVDIARLAGLTPAAVLCEVMNKDGTMARLPQLLEFAQHHNIKIGSIAALIAYRLKHDNIDEETSLEQEEKTKILIVLANFYPHISQLLLEGAKEELEKNNCQYEVIIVPGALEIPAAIAMVKDSGQYDGYIGLGCVIRGETTHYDYVCGESCRGLTDLSIHHQLAIGNGILTVENEEQALARADKNKKNKGGGAVLASLALINVKNHFIDKQMVVKASDQDHATTMDATCNG